MPESKTMKAGDLAKLLGAELSGDGDNLISSVRGASDIEKGCLTFLSNRKVLPAISASEAGAVLVEGFYDELSAKVQLKTANPHLAFARALEIFHQKPFVPRGIMPGAFIEENVKTGKEITVFPGAYISSGTIIGDRTVVCPNVFIGRDCRIGSDCILYPNVTIREEVVIGDRVIIHANAAIGSDGFRYVFDSGRHNKIPQVGTVEIGNDVEIGSGSAIDRAMTGKTVIGDGTKIDNLVQIGHNVKIGRHCILCGQVGIAGSTVVGDYVTMGGQVGVADHTSVESGTMIGAQSGLMGMVKKGVYIGSPSLPHKQWFKAQAVFEKLPELARTIRQLENKIKELEEKRNG